MGQRSGPPISRLHIRINPLWLSSLILLSAVVLPQIPSLNYGFINYDDYSTIVEFPLIRRLDFHTLPEFFIPTRRIDLPEYMPLKNLSYAVDYAIFGMSPISFRFQQWFWYAATVFFLFFWLRFFFINLSKIGRFGLKANRIHSLAFLTALFYALHPIHVESVTWLSGRKDVMSGAFSFAALLFALFWPGNIRTQVGWLVVALVSTLMALLSKPMAVILPILFFLQDLMLHRSKTFSQLLKERSPLYLGSTGMAILLFIIYLSLAKGLVAGVPDEVEWRLFHGPNFLRWGQQIGAFFWLSLMPYELVPFYPPSIFDITIFSIKGLGGILLLVIIPLLCGLGLWYRHILGFCLNFFIITLLPILVFSPGEYYVAGRYLYMGIAGIALAFLWSCAWLIDRYPRIKVVIIASALFVISSWTLSMVMYNDMWRNSYRLWSTAARTYPNFTEFSRQAGFAAFMENKPDEGIVWLNKCIELDPNNAECLSELGIRMMDESKGVAESLLKRALPYDKSGRAHGHFAMFLARTGRASQGATIYLEYLNKHPVSYKKYMTMVGLALLANDPKTALKATQILIRLMSVQDPSRPVPIAMILPVAEALGDDALLAQMQKASKECQRSDCFRQQMKW